MSRTLKAGRVATLVGGELIGPPDMAIAGIASLDEAGPGDLTFLATASHVSYLPATRAGAVLVTPEFRALTTGPATRIVVDDPRAALLLIADALHDPDSPTWGVHPTAVIGAGARWSGAIAVGAYAVIGTDVRIGGECRIGPHVTIGDRAVLGDRCRIDAHAVVADGVELGNGVVLKAGARVGTPGFAFVDRDGHHTPIPHIGACRLGDDVEIGANTTVDRGSVGATVIGAGTKIDNLVQVAHNVRIGRRCLIMAQAGIAGTTTIGDDVVIAGQAGLAGHLTVGDRARIAAQSGVIGDVPEGVTISGYPARDHRAVLRQAAALRRLAPIVATLERVAAQHGETS